MKLFERQVAVQFLGGSYNQNLHTPPSSDKDYKAFVLPSFEDLYEREMLKETLITPEKDIEVHDIRKLESLLYQGNLTYIEMLFSVDTQTFGFEEIDELLAMKDSLAAMNLPNLFYASYGMYHQQRKIINKLIQFQSKSDLAAIFKKSTLALHFLVTLERYCNNGFTDFRNCFVHDETSRQFMLSIKNGERSIEEVLSILDTQNKKVEELKPTYLNNTLNESTLDKLQHLLHSLVFRNVQK